MLNAIVKNEVITHLDRSLCVPDGEPSSFRCQKSMLIQDMCFILIVLIILHLPADGMAGTESCTVENPQAVERIISKTWTIPLFSTQTLIKSEELTLSVASPTLKVMKHDRIDVLEPSGRLSLRGARNQTRAFQLILSPNRPLENLRLALGDLANYSGVPGKIRFSYNIVGYVPIKTKAVLPEDWPDPLLPPLPVGTRDKSNIVFWVTFSIAANAESGFYTGVAKLLADDFEHVFEIQLHVLRYDLPVLCRLPVQGEVWHGWGVYQKTYAAIRWEDFAENAIAHRISGIGRFRIGNQDVLTAASEYFNNGFVFAWFPVQFIGEGDWSKRRKWGLLEIDPDNHDFADHFSKNIRSLAEKLRSKGWLKNTALFLWDEPFWRQDPVLRSKLPKLCMLVRQAAPDLPIFISHKPIPEMAGLVDIWGTALHFGGPDLSNKAVKALHDTGNKLLIYNNNLALINQPAINSRILPWIARKLDADGILWWSINFWGGIEGTAHLDPWKAGLSMPDRRHGDGYFLYPKETRDGVLNCIRWELFREGLNDYDTLYLLTGRLNSSKSLGNGRSQWIEKAEQILTEADAFIQSYNQFSKDASQLEHIVYNAEELLDSEP